MGILDKLFAAAEAIQAGKSLEDPAKWKNVTLLMGPIGIILTTIVNFTNLSFDDQAIRAINYGICTLGVGLYSYFTAATSEKVGLPPRNKSGK